MEHFWYSLGIKGSGVLGSSSNNWCSFLTVGKREGKLKSSYRSLESLNTHGIQNMPCCPHVNIHKHLCLLKQGLHSAVHMKSPSEPGKQLKMTPKGVGQGKLSHLERSCMVFLFVTFFSFLEGDECEPSEVGRSGSRKCHWDGMNREITKPQH